MNFNRRRPLPKSENLTLVYKVKTGRAGFVEKQQIFLPPRGCHGNLVAMPKAALNTLAGPATILERRTTEKAWAPLGVPIIPFTVQVSVDCDSRCYRVFVFNFLDFLKSFQTFRLRKNDITVQGWLCEIYVGQSLLVRMKWFINSELFFMIEGGRFET